jgi:hypothetical protein
LCIITSDMGTLSVCGWLLSTKRCRPHTMYTNSTAIH